jgi:L-aspartate oxidase
METDVLIIGCGIAGATTALRLAEDRERRITVITRAPDPGESNSSWAQGGIASRGADDSKDLFAEDVLSAGAGLSNPSAVSLLAEEGPRYVKEILIDQAGVQFDRGEDGDLAFGLEGAHSQRRILHVGDLTGEAIMRSLLDQVSQQPNIELLNGRTAVDLLTFPHHSMDPLAIYDAPACHGAYVFQQDTGKVERVVARQTVLATGGLGEIYVNTTNPPDSRGDGLAMAYRAGAQVINAEYVQFHPTALHMPGTTKFLISEALRGEGGVLLTPNGDSFMEKYAPEWGELAPRDVVARAIYWEIIANDYPYVLLDIASKKEAGYLRERFPQIYETCLEHDVDITKRPIPVVPAAHYFCGGLAVDLWGRTSIPGLYAVGEVACTGVHGANRLASTSLLEGLVWGARAAEDIRARRDGKRVKEEQVPPWLEPPTVYDTDPALIQGDMRTIRNLMWHYVGLVRNDFLLTRAIRELRQLWLNIEEFYRKSRLTDRLIGLRNSVLSALIVAQASYHNTTSRGCHYREDSRPNGNAAPPPTTHGLEPR